MLSYILQALTLIQNQWGLVNFDCSALWVRDRSNLVDALEVTPVFLRSKQGDSGKSLLYAKSVSIALPLGKFLGKVIDYRNWHLGLGRRFRSLKLWFVLRSFGAKGFRKHIRRVRHIFFSFLCAIKADLLSTKSIGLNDIFSGLISESKILSLVTPPSFALSVFRLVPAGVQGGLSLEALNELNRSLFGRLSARQDIMLTQTNLNGIFCIRLVIGAARTDEQHVRNAYDIVAEEAEGVLQAWHQTTEGENRVEGR